MIISEKFKSLWIENYGIFRLEQMERLLAKKES